MNLDLHTFDEWRKKGYGVIRGEKAIKVNHIPMFSRAQVSPLDNKPYEPYDDHEYVDGMGYWDWMNYKD